MFKMITFLRVISVSLHDQRYRSIKKISFPGWIGNEQHPLVLTHWGPDKMAAISQTTFSSAFSWMKMFEFRLKVHWSFFLRDQLTVFQHWFRWWLGAVQATSLYLNQWWLAYRRVTGPQWVKQNRDTGVHFTNTLVCIIIQIWWRWCFADLFKFLWLSDNIQWVITASEILFNIGSLVMSCCSRVPSNYII